MLAGWEVLVTWSPQDAEVDNSSHVVGPSITLLEGLSALSGSLKLVLSGVQAFGTVVDQVEEITG
ncbi:hypothetical protein H0H87_012565, partial [Tephrocybe sp. NHM501043]